MANTTAESAPAQPLGPTKSQPTSTGTPTPAPDRTWIWQAIPVLGLVALSFFVGMVLAINQTPPYRYVRDALFALTALQERHEMLASEWPVYQWYPARDQNIGVNYHAPEKSFGDYTVYTSAGDSSAVLIDMEGREVHRWTAPFRSVMPNNNHVGAWIPDHFVYMRRAVVFPNGDLVALYESTVTTPHGCGLVKLDRDSKVIWSYESHTHHDLQVAEDGRIYVLTNELRHLGDQDEALTELTTNPVVIEDTITMLSPEGTELKKVSILDALLASPYFRPLVAHVDYRGDLTHSNTLNLVSADFASHYEGVAEGDLMLCLRNLNLVLILNLDREEIVWAISGPWNHPHDPDPLDNGNVLIFNNFLANGTEHGSSVLEFDPRTRQTVWSYQGEANQALRSDIRACQQLLPGGNILITESDQGRIVEVDRSGHVVWEFVNPRRGGPNQELIPIVCGAHRYSRTEIPFVDTLAVPAQQSNLTALAE